MNKGRFIVVEGLEGAGKSTALHTLRDALKKRVPELITTREPGGTHVGEVVRDLMKETSPDDILDPRAELLLLYASRVQLVEHVIRPALLRGCWVLGDRFEWSTWAYQGGGRRLDKTIITELSSFCLNGFQPDLIFFLDISPEEGLARAAARGKYDRMEQESLAFFKDVHAAYQTCLSRDNVVVIDASQPLAVVQSSIQHALEAYLAS